MFFANSLDPDQARQNMGPDLEPNCLMVFLKEFFEKKKKKKKKSTDYRKACKLTQHAKSWRGILLLELSSVRSLRFFMHSITLEPCMLLF